MYDVGFFVGLSVFTGACLFLGRTLFTIVKSSFDLFLGVPEEENQQDYLHWNAETYCFSGGTRTTTPQKPKWEQRASDFRPVHMMAP